MLIGYRITNTSSTIAHTTINPFQICNTFLSIIVLGSESIFRVISKKNVFLPSVGGIGIVAVTNLS